MRYTDGNLVSGYGTFFVEVTDTKPWFHSEIPNIERALYSASFLIPLSSYFSDPNGDTLMLTATYKLGTSTPVSIPGGIFTKPTSYEIAV